MAVNGIPDFDTLKVMSIHIDYEKRTMIVDGAFTNSRTGRPHAWFREVGAVWSKETKEKVAELEKMIEADMAKVHFHSSEGSRDPEGSRIVGIGEHVADETPSI